MHRNSTFQSPEAPSSAFTEFIRTRHQSDQLGELTSAVKPKISSLSMVTGAIITANKNFKNGDQKTSRRVSARCGACTCAVHAVFDHNFRLIYI